MRGGRKRGRETDRGYSMGDRRRGKGEGRGKGGPKRRGNGSLSVGETSCRERGEPKRERKVVVVIWMFP